MVLEQTHSSPGFYVYELTADFDGQERTLMAYIVKLSGLEKPKWLWAIDDGLDPHEWFDTKKETEQALKKLATKGFSMGSKKKWEPVS